MKKIALLLVTIFCIISVFAQQTHHFPVRNNAATISEENDWVSIADGLFNPAAIRPDTVKRLSLTTLEFVKNGRQYQLMNWLSGLKNLEEIYIYFWPETHKYLEREINDSLLLVANEIFKQQNIKFVTICNSNYDSTGFILNHLLAGVNTIEYVCFQYKELTDVQLNLPDFIVSCPNLKSIGVLSSGYPVILEPQFIAKFPAAMQNTSLSARLNLLYTLADIRSDFRNKYHFRCSISPYRDPNNLFAVFLGNFDMPWDKHDFEVDISADSVKGPFYIINSISDNFYNIGSDTLKNINTLLMYGELKKKQLKFIKNNISVPVFMNIVKEYPKQKKLKNYPNSNLIFFKLNEDAITTVSIEDFFIFKEKRVPASSLPIYFYELYKKTH